MIDSNLQAPDRSNPSKRIEAIQHILATLFAAQNALRALAPEFRWAGLGNLLGDFGECIAIDHYNLKKASASSGEYDALTSDGETVQIKTNHSVSQIGFRGEADLLLVLHVSDDGTWEEVYFGEFQKVKELSRYSQRDNKHMIAISKLKKLRKQEAQSDERSQEEQAQTPDNSPVPE